MKKTWTYLTWIPVIVAILLACGEKGLAQSRPDMNGPDTLVRSITTDVMQSIKKNPSMQQGDIRQLTILVNEKILPHTDMEKTTRLVMGPYWAKTTEQQKQQLIEQFKDLLFYTYAGAISHVRDQEIQYLPSHLSSQASDAVVRTQVVSEGSPIQLDYRLEKTRQSWKVYDLNIGGVWLVQNYRQQFNRKISQVGIEGLIQELTKQNQQRAASKAIQ